MPLTILLGTEAAGYEVEIDGRTYRPLLLDSSGRLYVAVYSSALPAGAATAAKQDTMITALQLIDDLRAALAAIHTDQLRVDVITPFTPTSSGSGQLNVTTAGTRVQLPSQACKAVSIAAKPANTGNVYLGDSSVTSANGRILDAGDTIDLAIDDLSRLYIDADTDGEGISYLWVS